MNGFKRDRILSAVVLSAVLVIGLESWSLWRMRAQAAHEIAGLDQKKRERDDLQRRSPRPDRETESAIFRELSEASAQLVEVRAAVMGAVEQHAEPSPAKPIDAYFEIARFVEKERDAAARFKVSIRSDEYFGFRSHAREGPNPQFLSAVMKQCVVVENLLDALFACRPAALISVQRERPLPTAPPKSAHDGAAVKGVATPASSHDEPADFFEPARSTLLRVPSKLETDAFLLEFSGQTATLRDFLYRLAEVEQPLCVRSVEVEPISNSARPSNASGPSSEPISIVVPTISRFRLMVEMIRAVPAVERQIQ